VCAEVSGYASTKIVETWGIIERQVQEDRTAAHPPLIGNFVESTIYRRLIVQHCFIHDANFLCKPRKMKRAVTVIFKPINTLRSEYESCKIRGLLGGDNEECRLLGYKNPVRTSQETLRFRYRTQQVNAI
jgi:hypothetical protein